MKVPLAARPGRGHRFVRWEGACTGARGCTAALGRAPVSVTAVFAPPTFRFGVVVAGRGTVRLGDRSTCRSTCVRGVASFSRLRLEAHAAPGWRLAGWSSPCRGSRPICTIAVERPMSVRVSFVETGA
jgi:hypothetical protein